MLKGFIRAYRILYVETAMRKEKHLQRGKNGREEQRAREIVGYERLYNVNNMRQAEISHNDHRHDQDKTHMWRGR
jgi:hypothetical protein